MKIYNLETLYRDLPEQLEDIKYGSMPYGDEDTDTRSFLYINKICVFCDAYDIMYMPVSCLGPSILFNLTLNGELAANFILRIDDELIVDNEFLTVMTYTSEETMRELAEDMSSLHEEENPEAYNNWLKEQQSRVLDIIKTHNEKRNLENDDEGILSSVEAFESFMKENIKLAIDDIIQKREKK